MSAEYTVPSQEVAPIATRSITRRRLLEHLGALAAVGLASAVKIDLPSVIQQVTLSEQKPAEVPQAAPIVVTRPTLPSPYERRLLYPKGDLTDDARHFQRYLNDWKHDMTRKGAEVQMISNRGSKFEVLTGVKIRKYPITDSNEPDNLVTPRSFSPGKTGYYSLAIHLILPDKPQNGVWLPINYNPTTHFAEYSRDNATNAPAVVAMEFNGEHLIKDINRNLHPDDFVEMPW